MYEAKMKQTRPLMSKNYKEGLLNVILLNLLRLNFSLTVVVIVCRAFYYFIGTRRLQTNLLVVDL